MEDNCPICVERFNKSTKRKAACVYCDYTVCRTCLQQYLLTTTEDAHCMNCKKKWNREQLDDLVTKTFRNGTYKERRENILLEREKALLPATQPEVKRRKRLFELIEMRKELTAQRRTVDMEYYRLLNRTISGTDKEEKHHFCIHCPVGECRGYVSASDWKCGTCTRAICSKCFEEKNGDQHECNPASVETANTLKKETRSCPNCATLIYKISGCNQMWCTQCHTAFDWVTGRKEAGVVHNPHFYEWQQMTGQQRAAGDIPCGGLPNLYTLRTVLTTFMQQRQIVVAPPEISRIYSIHRNVVHMQNVDMPQYRVNNNNDNLELRIKYLLNQISEEEFKVRLQKREKMLSKMKETYDVYEMFVFTMVDLFQNLFTELVNNCSLENIGKWIEQVKLLYTFANEQFSKISKRYNSSSTPYILPLPLV